MNKTIYVKDEDLPTWDRAKELAGERLSPIIATSLKKFVAEKEAEQKGFERIEYEFSDVEVNGFPRKKAFYGRWIFPPSNPETIGSEDSPEFDCAVVAVTAKGAVVACTWSEDQGGQTYKYFRVYPSFDEGAKDKRTSWAVKLALRTIGVPVEELDI